MSSESSPKCPQCGAPIKEGAPAGLCPNCLMALNLKTETVFTGDAPAAQTPLPPEQIAPHFPQFEILECLGRGGMGVVYKARQKTLNRFVALKLLAPERVNDPKFAERFSREALALAALNHPNIVTVYDFGKAGGSYFLLMEFVDGVNLRELLRARKFTPEEALAIVPPLCDALQFAHDRGVVHRDIKPENLLVDKAGRVKIADFGIAKMLGPGNNNDTPGTTSPEHVTQSVVGTRGYSAPEQQSSPQRVDSRADIYSLGVVLYEMLTGEMPGKPIEPPSRKVQIDVRLDSVVLRALEKTPELRWQTAMEMRTQVESIAQTEPVALPRSLRPRIFAAAAAAILLLGAGFSWWLFASIELPGPTDPINFPRPSKTRSTAQSEPGFMPEVVRELAESEPSRRRINFMRLDNGVILTLRRQTNSSDFGPEELTWMRNKEVDVHPWFTTNGQHVQEAGLIAVDMLTRKISPAFHFAAGPDGWSNLSAATVIEALREEQKAWPYPSPLRTLTMRDNTGQSVAWAFRTRNGHMGVLQIVGFAENPPTVQVHYKLVRPADTSSGTRPLILATPQAQQWLSEPAPANPPAPATQSKEAFDPLLERVISRSEANDQGLIFFDMETGQRKPPPFPLLLRSNHGPALVELSTELLEWVKSNRMDVLIQFSENTWNVMNFRMEEDYVAPPTHWERVTADAVAAVFASKDAAKLERDEVPASSLGNLFDDRRGDCKAFRTRSNTLGMMQWAGLRTAPHGVKIRYKLLQGSTTRR